MATLSQVPDGIAVCCPECGSEVNVASMASAGDTPCPNCRHLFWFTRQPVDEVVVLTFLPGLMLASESLKRIDEVSSAIGDYSRVVLDLSHLRFISSIFLGMLIALQQRVISPNETLKICSTEPGDREVLRMTKLDKVFDVHADIQIAINSF